MGKQVSIYLSDEEAQQLTQIAIRQCRNLNDQARYFLLSSLSQNANSDTYPRQGSGAAVASQSYQPAL